MVVGVTGLAGDPDEPPQPERASTRNARHLPSERRAFGPSTAAREPLVILPKIPDQNR